MRLLPRVDAVVMAAAVTDWKPAVRARAKMKRKEGWNLHLVPTRDILAEVCRRRKASQYIIGFALETHRMVLHGVEKFRNKGADCIIANTPAFFGSGRSGKAAIILHDRVRLLSRTTKARVAAQVVGLIARQLARHRTARRN